MTFASSIWEFQRKQCDFEEALEEAGFVSGEHYKRIGWDEYDCSIEFHGVKNDARLSAELQRIIYNGGFIKAYVNHEDGWETHYTWKGGHFEPVRGWRRHMVHEDTPSASGVIMFKKMKISYLPDTWRSTQLERDLSAGKIEIVPGPLEPALPQ